jgi:hypothetical protein
MSAQIERAIRDRFVNDWEYQEELSRWIDRAHVELARLPAGSHGRRQQELAIRRMEHHQLRRSLSRAQDRLSGLPRRSDERRELERAISQMEEDYDREYREIRIDMENSRGAVAEAVAAREHEVDLERTLSDAREALSLAAVHLRSLSLQPGREEAMTKVDRALARLDTYRRLGRP